jgi:hypothetical protein
MEWKISNAKGSGTDYLGHAGTASFADAAPELWRKFLEASAPLNADLSWDHLRVEIWLDSGRVILFPATALFRHRIEKSSCQMICPDLLNFYETLIESDLPDDQMEKEITAKEFNIIAILSAAAKALDLPTHLNRPFITVLYYGADTAAPAKKEVFIL